MMERNFSQIESLFGKIFKILDGVAFAKSSVTHWLHEQVAHAEYHPLTPEIERMRELGNKGIWGKIVFSVIILLPALFFAFSLFFAGEKNTMPATIIFTFFITFLSCSAIKAILEWKKNENKERANAKICLKCERNIADFWGYCPDCFIVTLQMQLESELKRLPFLVQKEEGKNGFVYPNQLALIRNGSHNNNLMWDVIAKGAERFFRKNGLSVKDSQLLSTGRFATTNDIDSEERILLPADILFIQTAKELKEIPLNIVICNKDGEPFEKFLGIECPIIKEFEGGLLFVKEGSALTRANH